MKRTRLIKVALSLAAGLGVVSCLIRGDIPAGELEARYAGAASHFVEVRGVRVHYQDVGSGPPIVLLHGSNASLFTWEGWQRELSSEHRVISLDLPGHGLTGPDPLSRYRFADLVEFLEEFRVQLGLPRFSLAGSSMGGGVAWRYALLYPERVERLILIDAVGYPREEPRPWALRLIAAPVLGEIFSVVTPRFVVGMNVREVYGDPSRVTDERITRYYELLLHEGNRRATRERLRQDTDDGLWRRLPDLRTPTLILWGAKDTWVLPKYAGRFHEDIPGSRLIEYPELGHVPMEEDPVLTAGDARRFLDTP
jgi:pimeloyl-ACP methyl ester carboxylesterase